MQGTNSSQDSVPQKRHRPNVNTNRLPGLDGLRAIAIIAVFIYHFGLLPGGYLGVDVFFVLSGYLISNIIITEVNKNLAFDFLRFYIRRTLRLLPALILLLIVYTIFVLTFRSGAQRHYDLWESIIVLCYSTNWARAFNHHPPIWLGHTWSLAIEEQFYIVWPSALLGLIYLRQTYGSKTNYIPFILAISSVILSIILFVKGYSIPRIYNGLDTHLVGIMIGAGIAMFDGNAPQRLLPPKWLGITCLGLLFALFLFVPYSKPVLLVSALPTASIISALLIIEILARPESLVARILSHPALVWIGIRSYGIYLWHYPIIMILVQFQLRARYYIPLSLALTLIVSIASFELLEKRMLSLKERFNKNYVF